MNKRILITFAWFAIISGFGQIVSAQEDLSSVTDTQFDQSDQSLFLAQEAYEESIQIFQREYPLANIEAISVSFDRKNLVFLINIKGYDAYSSYSLEVEYVDYGVRQQVFSDGLFQMKPRETKEVDPEDKRTQLDVELLKNLEDVTKIALSEVDYQGVVVTWTLFSDTREWWDIFKAAEENENPIWLLELDYQKLEAEEDTKEDFVFWEIEANQSTKDSEKDTSIDNKEFTESNDSSEETIELSNEIRIDAMTGEILRDKFIE